MYYLGLLVSATSNASTSKCVHKVRIAPIEHFKEWITDGIFLATT